MEKFPKQQSVDNGSKYIDKAIFDSPERSDYPIKPGESDQEHEILPPSAEELMEGCRFKEHQEEIAEEMLNLSFKVLSRVYACEALANKEKYLYSDDNSGSFKHETTASDNANIEKMKQEIRIIDSVRRDMSCLFYGTTEKIIEFDEVAIATEVVKYCNSPWTFLNIDGDSDKDLERTINATLEDDNPYDESGDFAFDGVDPGPDYVPYNPEYATFGEKLYDYLGYKPSEKILPEDLDELNTERPIPDIFVRMHKQYVKTKKHEN